MPCHVVANQEYVALLCGWKFIKKGPLNGVWVRKCMHIQGCQLSPIIQGTQDFGPYLPQPRLQGSLLTRPYGAREREALVWFGHMSITCQQFCRHLCSLKWNISYLHRLSFVMMGNKKMYHVQRNIQWQVLTNKCNKQRMTTIRRMKRRNHADQRQNRQHNLRNERLSCTYSI